MKEIRRRTVRGRGSIGKAAEICGNLGIKNPLVIGNESLVARLMKKNPVLLSSPVFSAYHPNPDLQDAEPAAEIFRRQKCDGLISVGGGSAMDTAKAVKAVLYAGNAEKASGGFFPEHMETPHLAIPGTAGTGAEATGNAVVYLNERKISLSHPDLRPDSAILDADLLDSLPLYHRKSAALDALCQGIESYWCAGATEESRVHAFLAIIGVLDNLKAYLDGEVHAAEEMMDAAYQSGKAIQITRTTAAHAMSYQLTKMLGIAHGHACMLTLPVLWEMMLDREEMAETLRDLSSKMRLGNPQLVPELLRGILYDLEMDIPPMPAEETLDRLADSVNTERLGNHPVPMTCEDVKEAYRRSFELLCGVKRQTCIDIWRYYNEG